MNRRWTTFAWAAALFYAVLLLFIWSALTHRADLQTESMLDYAMLDLDATLNGSIDTMLMHVGESIVEEVGHARPLPVEEVARIVGQRDIDEVNIFDRTGLNLASSDARCSRTASATPSPSPSARARTIPTSAANTSASPSRGATASCRWASTRRM